MASDATTVHGCRASAWNAVMRSPNFAASRSCRAWASTYFVASIAIDAPARLPIEAARRRRT